MSTEWELLREPSVRATTFGDWMIDGKRFCHTLEDQNREIVGEPVSQWKIKGETCIPAGRYELRFEDSQRFGPDTITIVGVPGFDKIRAHGGTDISDTEGCVEVGDVIDRNTMTIHGAKLRGVLDKLKRQLFLALEYGPVYLTIRNPEPT